MKVSTLVVAVLAQSCAAMIAVVAARVVAGDRLTVTGAFNKQFARDSVFAIAFVCFSRIKKIARPN